MKASYCTLIYEGNELLTALEDVKRAGYQGIELYPKDWRWALNSYSLEEFADIFQRFGNLLGKFNQLLLHSGLEPYRRNH